MLSEREVRALGGLTDPEAASRLARDGPNEITTARARGRIGLLGEIAGEPMILLLLACGAVYLVLGDREEALVLLASVFVVIGITLYQSRRAERALEALRDLSSPRALVVRGGTERRIAGRDVVAGDLVVVAEGDRVPADATLLWAINVRVDESLLSGESVPVAKSVDDGAVYAGTLVVSGQGIARVDATGPRTRLGAIGTSLATVEPTATSLERQVHGVVRIVAVGGIALCLVVAGLYGLRRGDWLGGALAGLALAMSVMPEEFPMILTLFLALGAWRISRRNVLVRRMPALEALGAATVLCVDKTGTLTENRMAVAALAVNDSVYELRAHGGEALPERFHPSLEFALLASQANAFDPMERAIDAAARALLRDTEHLHAEWALVREYPLSPALLAMSHVWRAVDGGAWTVAAKGAPEAIADLCHLAPTTSTRLRGDVEALAARGLRVLAVAGTVVRAPALPVAQHDFAFELLGLLALADPVRASAPAAVRECRTAGIRTVMLTGDYPATARAIAAQVGLADGALLTGAELEALDDATLAERIRATTIFARIQPEQKLRLVRAFQAAGDVVAMTGDGVNDAPALRAADIGVAMGARGTDVAREAVDLVVVDDDFASIAAAVRLGRRIFDNIRKAIGYAMAVHVPIAAVSLLPVAAGWPLVLLPVHIVLLELVIDPTCSVAFEAEPEEPDVMARPPRDPHDPLLRRTAIAESLLLGAVAACVVCGMLVAARLLGWSADETRTVTFATLMLANVGLILASRTTGRAMFAGHVRNRALGVVVAAALGALGVALAVPFVRSALRLAAPSAAHVGAIVTGGAGALAAFGLVKRARLR